MTQTSAAVKVVVRAPDPVDMLGARTMLESHPRLTVLAEAELAEADVVVVVAEAVADTSLDWLRREQEDSATSAVHCVLVSDDLTGLSALNVVECNIVAMLPRRDLRREQLVRVVVQAKDGIAHLPPAMQGSLLAEFRRLRSEVLEPHGLTIHGLSARERDVLRLLAEGMDTEKIAAELAYSERTVKNVLYAVMARNNLNTRAHAVAYAVRIGVV